jgi:hypothetical protein
MGDLHGLAQPCREKGRMNLQKRRNALRPGLGGPLRVFEAPFAARSPPVFK